MKTIHTLLVVALLALAPGLTMASNVQFLRDSPISKMTPEDLTLMRATIRESLDQGADGASRRWENPKTGASGIVTPLKSYQRDGAPCRLVEIFNEAQGFSGRTRYDFCKQPDGAWKMPAPAATRR